MNKLALCESLDKKEDNKVLIQTVRNSISNNQYPIYKWAHNLNIHTKKELRWIKKHETFLLSSIYKNPSKEKIYAQVSYTGIKTFTRQGKIEISPQFLIESFDTRYIDAILFAVFNAAKHDFRLITCLSIINKGFRDIITSNEFWEKNYGIKNILHAVANLTGSSELPVKFNGMPCMQFLTGLRCPIIIDNKRSLLAIETMSLSITLGLTFAKELLKRVTTNSYKNDPMFRIVHGDLRHRFGRVDKLTDTQALLKIGEILIKKTKNGINMSDSIRSPNNLLMDITQISLVCNYIINCILFNPCVTWNDIVLSFNQDLVGRTTGFSHFALLAMTVRNKDKETITLFE